MLAHRTTFSLKDFSAQDLQQGECNFVDLPAVSYWKCSRAHVIVETSFVCHGRTEPVRPLATFSPTALGSWAQSRDGFCKCLPCCRLSVLSSPFWGGNRLQSLAVVYTDRNRLPGIRWTIQGEQQRCGSLRIDKSSIQAAFVDPHISLPTMLDSLCCSQVRRSGQSGTTLRAPPQLISLHVFDDDTVAKVAVSEANLRIFCVGSCWALPLSLLLRCLALWRNANLAGGFAGRFLVVVLVVWLVSHDDLPEIFGPHESCTLLLFTAYAIVRTVPSANRPNRKEKKTAVCIFSMEHFCLVHHEHREL